MSIGVELSDKDLEAIRYLFRVRWDAEITNWKERGTDYCMWFVKCSDLNEIQVTQNGLSLADTIYELLENIHIDITH